MIGIFFPIGLIMLAISIFRSKIFNAATPFLLVGGALLFPVGRIAGIVPAVIGSGALLFAAFGLIGWHIITQNRTQFSESELARLN
jgi:hypothetical protein